MMAPYTYRSQLTLPKLLVNGTNDPYWVIDAQKLYWSDLQGPRYTLFLANADHDLNDQRQKALQTNAVFGQMVACNRQMPQLEWDSQQDGRKLTVRMKSDRKPVTAVLWSGQSQTTDFRKSHFSAVPMTLMPDEVTWENQAEAAHNHLIAAFAEFTFGENGIPFSLTSQVFCSRFLATVWW